MRLDNWILLAAVLSASGCAAFQSGDVRVSRSDLKAMLSDTTVEPFADIKVSWKSLPYKNPLDTIGEGSISNPPKPQPVPVPPGDLARFRERAKSILADAGLYDVAKGSGTLELEMASVNRWTYKELLRSFMVETPFIFIVPASLKTGYRLTAGFQTPSGTAVVEEAAQRKTAFHLLLVPLYPFFSPGAKESSLINNMLWKVSTDVYRKIKHPAPLPAAGAGAVQESAPPLLPPAPSFGGTSSQASEGQAPPSSAGAGGRTASPEPDTTPKKASGEAAEADD
jgi:hypothetical protein